MSITRKHFLVVLAALLITSIYVLRSGTERAAEAAGRRAQSEQQLKQAETVQKGLRHAVAGAHEKPLLSLDRELAETLLMLEQNRAVNMLEFSSLNTTKAQASRDAIPLDGISSPLGQTDNSVRSVDLFIKANYHDYIGLKRFLSSISKRPVAIRKLKVNTTSVEMNLLVLGI